MWGQKTNEPHVEEYSRNNSGIFLSPSTHNISSFQGPYKEKSEVSINTHSKSLSDISSDRPVYDPESATAGLIQRPSKNIQVEVRNNSS